MSGTILLYDGNALVHRAYHALPPLTTSRGELVNAVFGFAQMVLKAISDFRPEYWAIAFDRPAPTFRHKDFPAYKAQRAKMPDDLRAQFGRVRELVAALGLPAYETDGYEADDVLGTLALQARQAGLEVIIVSGDADTLQLVRPGLRALTPGRSLAQTNLYDATAVREKFGVAPEQLPDLKGLSGDKSDNIPGVPGVGPKTAARLLIQFGSIEKVYASLDALDARTRELLAPHAEAAAHGKWLTTIVTDAPVLLSIDASRVGIYDRQAALGVLRELEFNTLVGRLPPSEMATPGTPFHAASAARATPTLLDVRSLAVQTPLFAESPQAAEDLDAKVPDQYPGHSDAPDPTARVDRSVVDNMAALEEMRARLQSARAIALYVDMAGASPHTTKPAAIALADSSGHTYFLPLRWTKEPGTAHPDAALAPEDLLSELRVILEDARISKYTHDAKIASEALGRCGIRLQGIASDSMLAAYLLDAAQRDFSLRSVASRYLGLDLPEPILPAKGKSSVSAEVSSDETDQGSDAAACAEAVYRLACVMQPKLAQVGLLDLFRDVELRLVPILVDMEEVGVDVDPAALSELSRRLAERIEALESQTYTLAGRRFNLNSTQQLATILFTDLGLPKTRKTKTGYSTDAEVLEELRGSHAVIDLILEYRQLQKLKSTYIDTLPALISPQTRRIHTTFHQTGAVTGRLSSSDPNLQNIPVRTELGREVRSAFAVRTPGHILVAADYSQIDLRVMAHFSHDSRLIQAFLADLDIHAVTASEVYGVPIRQVTPDMRRVAKTINFGVIYGISDYGLSSRSVLSRGEAAAFIDRYFATYPGIRSYMEHTKEQAARLGYVSTLLGRRRYLPEIHSPNRVIRQSAERMAINMPIQGTSADIVKLAMIAVWDALNQTGMSTKMVLQVHDELVFEAPQLELDQLKILLKTKMQSVQQLVVPLKVDLKQGSNWRDVVAEPDTMLFESEPYSLA